MRVTVFGLGYVGSVTAAALARDGHQVVGVVEVSKNTTIGEDDQPQLYEFLSQVESDRTQARFVLRHPWTGAATCAAAAQYRQELQQRRERESQTLASLTGWNISDIRKKMGFASNNAPAESPVKWWERLWK